MERSEKDLMSSRCPASPLPALSPPSPLQLLSFSLSLLRRARGFFTTPAATTGNFTEGSFFCLLLSVFPPRQLPVAFSYWSASGQTSALLSLCQLSLGWEPPMPLPAPAALLTGGPGVAAHYPHTK